MNPWTWVGVDEPGSRVEGGEPVLCDYGANYEYTLPGAVIWNIPRLFEGIVYLWNLWYSLIPEFLLLLWYTIHKRLPLKASFCSDVLWESEAASSLHLCNFSTPYQQLNKKIKILLCPLFRFFAVRKKIQKKNNKRVNWTLLLCPLFRFFAVRKKYK
jgi:hypothetical protein